MYEPEAPNSSAPSLPPSNEVVQPTTSQRSLPSKPQATWTQQVATLTGRFAINYQRDWRYSAGAAVQALVLGLVIMSIFWHLPASEEGVMSRYGLCYIIIVAHYYNLLVSFMERYCNEMKVFDREQQDGSYYPSAYMTAHYLASIPHHIIHPLMLVSRWL